MTPRWESALVAALAALPILLCLDAAISIDAPVFVAVAEQIAKHPADPFGFELVWDPTSPRVAEFNHNPPLLSYWLAPVVAWAGRAEWALHLALLPFAVTAALAFLGIARRLAPSPDAGGGSGQGAPPTWLLLCSPVFPLLSTTLLLDVPVLAATLLAVYALLRADEGRRGAAWQWLAGAAVAAAGLFKYVGFSAAPLLGAALVLLRGSGPRGAADWLRVLGLPLLVWAGWGAWSQALYGQVHYLGGLALVGQKSFGPRDFFNQMLSLPVYYGVATGFPMLAWLASLRREGRGTEWAVAGGLAGVACVWFVLPEGTPLRRAPLDWEEGALGAWGFAGAVLLWGFCGWRALRASQPADRFLLLWLGGFLAFSWFVNWHVNAADALMAAPPLLLLWFRSELRPTPRTAALWAGLLGVVALLLLASDVRQRNVYRQAAAAIAAEIGDAAGARWNVGQWGFQYYLEPHGFEPVRPPQFQGRFALSEPVPGDWVASARNVSQLDVRGQLSGYAMRAVRVWRFEGWLPLRTTHPDAGGGFYSHQSGFVPYAWSRAPLEEVGLARITAVVR